MNTEDDDIKAFFADMRKDDRQHEIPKFEEMFPKKRPSRMWYMLPVSIAASLIVGFGVFTHTPEGNTLEEDELVISIGDQETTTETLLSTDTSVFSWESSTASLINDFND